MRGTFVVASLFLGAFATWMSALLVHLHSFDRTWSEVPVAPFELSTRGALVALAFFTTGHVAPLLMRGHREAANAIAIGSALAIAYVGYTVLTSAFHGRRQDPMEFLVFFHAGFLALMTHVPRLFSDVSPDLLAGG